MAKEFEVKLWANDVSIQSVQILAESLPAVL